MLPLAVQIRVEAPAGERRSAPRHSLGLAVAAPIRAVVENISQTGLALRTHAALAAGDLFDLELPLAGTVAARVAWTQDELLGCEFAAPISKAAVSAARLRSPFDPPQAAVMPAAESAGSVAAPQTHFAAALGVMLASLCVAAMFVAALLTAPFPVP